MKAYRIIFTLMTIIGFMLPRHEVSALSNYDFTVNTTTDSHDFNLNDGACSDKDLSDPDKKCSLRAAMEQISFSGGTLNSITVPAGDYYLTNGTLNSTKNVTITGAGASGINPTMISTNSENTTGISSASQLTLRNIKVYGFLHGVAVGGGTTLIENCIINGNARGLNVTGGSVTVNTSNIKENLLGIWIQGTSAIVVLDRSNVALNEGNSSSGCAGVKITNGGSLSAFASTFTENKAESEGGAICNYGGNVTLDGSFVSFNSARLKGGGIYQEYGVITIKNGTLVSNNESQQGGAVYNVEGQLLIESIGSPVEISDNMASYAYGGIYIGHSTGTLNNRLDNVIIRDNRAPSNGGLAYYGKGSLTIKNSSFIDNQSYLLASRTPLEGDGGGLIVNSNSGLVNIINTTFSGNSTSRHGGGMALKTGVVQLSNVTVTGNTADSDNYAVPDGEGSGSGGGIYIGTATVTMRNSIVAGNFDLTSGVLIQGYDVHGALVSAGYNLIGGCDFLCSISGVTTGNIVGTNNSRINPRLGTLTYDDFAIRYGTLVHPLLADSPAANAGNPAGCLDQNGVVLLEDQVGNMRTQWYRCDMGAHESAIEYAGGCIFIPLVIR